MGEITMGPGRMMWFPDPQPERTDSNDAYLPVTHPAPGPAAAHDHGRGNAHRESVMITKCPYCGRTNDMHDGVEPEDQPAPGDISLCWLCHGAAIFTENGVRVPDSAEMAVIDAAPEVRAARAAMSETYTPSQANVLRRVS